MFISILKTRCFLCIESVLRQFLFHSQAVQILKENASSFSLLFDKITLFFLILTFFKDTNSDVKNETEIFRSKNTYDYPSCANRTHSSYED
jgi:hypothetical protein